MRRLPFEPLRCHMKALGVVVTKGQRPGLATVGWCHNSAEVTAWWRAMREGSLTFRSADKLTTSLGLHPAEIWGQAWYQRHTSGR